MNKVYIGKNKQPGASYFGYELFESEPKIKRRYYMSPELEDELLDHSYFLKRRVWRQMKRMQKDNSTHIYSPPETKHKPSGFNTVHHLRAV